MPFREIRKFRDIIFVANSFKCQYQLNSISCLGYTLDTKCFKLDVSFIDPLIQAHLAKNISAIRPLIGVIQFRSRFIPNFPKLLSPLFGLVSNTDFVWEQRHEDISRNTL